MLKKKKILVFGHGGYLGHEFCKQVEEKNLLYKPVFEKHKSRYNLGNFYFSKINSLIKKNKFDYIINFHAQTDIDLANKNFKYDFFHNCSIVHSIVNSMIKNKSKSFFLNLGTVTQVGFTNIYSKISMNYKNNPIDIVDLHKQYNEDFISINKFVYNLNASTLRLSNIFGRGNKSFSKKRGVINKLIEKSILEGEINLYGDGNNVRDFLYIKDAIKGIIFALKYSKNLKDSFYYLTSSEGNSFNDLATILSKSIKKNYNVNIKINYKKWPKNTHILDKRSFVGNNTSFRKATKWKPDYNLNGAVKDYIKNFINENK